MPFLSVIIPTHRRAPLLAECLRHLAAQSIADQLEVIVVSDEPDPATAALMKHITNNQQPVTNYLQIPKCHQGAARNRGVERATAPLVLFIGDDIYLEPEACSIHARAHLPPRPLGEGGQGRRGLSDGARTPIAPIAVLGFTTWDPSLRITPTMRWLEASGWQFGYPLIERFAHGFLPEDRQERFTYTSHISIPRDVARKFPFREDVSLYGWEDIEWGMRLKEAGIRLFYEPDAEAFHHHPLTLHDSLKRAETLGRSLVRMAEIHPGFRPWLAPRRLILQRLRSFLPTLEGMHRRAFLKGIRNY